jgi:DNA invertase Pin-like site-specific DNA recombinase
MKIGYIRVSKQEQNEALQRDTLKEAGCEKYFSDKMNHLFKPRQRMGALSRFGELMR